MYTEENEKRGFPLRDFLLKLILVIIFALLLVWLLPKFITPKMPSMDLTPLTSQIFADNLKRMQDAATSYYTTERLPKEVGDKDTMTLRDMIAKKLVVPFVDKNGKACDVDGSYVTITKLDNEYLMKVNLKCSDQEDYVLVHMGCYNYCDSDLCAKREEPVITTPTKPVPTPTPTPTPDPTPTPQPEVCPITSCSTGQTLINAGSKDCYCKDDIIPTPEPKKEYEYTKTEAATYSSWTPWSNWVRYVNADNIQALSCEDSDPTCLKRVKLKVQREQIGVYPVSYVQKSLIEDPSLSYKEYYCAEYTYEKYGNSVYARKNGQWVDRGTATYTVPPEDTATTIYELVGSKYLPCTDACQTLPQFTYRKWEYVGESYELVGSNASIAVSCAVKEYKTISVYVNKYEKLQREEPAFADVKYYSVQTRSITSNARSIYKWSYYNDLSLLNNQWKYTGNTRDKK